MSDVALSEDVREPALVSLIDEEGFMGGDGTAVGTLENALGFEVGEVFTDGVFGEVEKVGEFFDGNLTLLLDEGGDLVATLIRKHK